MQTVDTIICGRWIMTVNAEFQILDNAAIAIDNGVIIDVAAKSAIFERYNTNNCIERDSHVLMPGFINTHNHSAMTMLRGYADDMPLMTWLNDHIWPAEQKYVDRQFIEIGTRLGVAQMLLTGTTTCNEMYYFPDVAATVFQQAGMRAMLGMIVIDFPTVWAENADEYFAKGLALHDEYRHSALISTVFAPHAPYSVCDESLRRISVLAEELDCQVHMHLHETAFEIEQSNAQYGMRPLERINQLGLLNQRLMAVHMTQLLDGEIKTLADLGVNVIHCAKSNMKLASGFCPVDSLLQSNINVALGTDGAASNNTLDMLSEMQFAALLAKGHSKNPEALNARQSIEMATINGATALGLQERIGSLEIGKEADIIAIDMQNVATTPLFNITSQIVYSVGSNQVSDVWVAGKQLVQNAQLQSVDLEQTLAQANALSQNMKP